MMNRIAPALLVGLAAACFASAGPLGTTLTYQGILVDAGTPVDGVVDLRFTLWDAETGGTHVGSTLTIDDLTVFGGRVTAPLDFGDVFNGSELWLAIEVRDGASTGAYTLLDPRQRLTAAPFASHSLTAGTATSATTAGHATSADSATSAANATTADSALTAGHATTAGSASIAGDADTLDGQHGTYFLAWANLTGKPGGLDDGDQDTLGSLSCNPDEIARWSGSSWVCAPAGGGSSFSRTLVVGPVGDAAANGAALIAAVDSIPAPATAADGWIVWLEPGDYDLGGANFFLLNHVHLRGAGRLATRVFSAACGSPVARVIGINTSEISDLTIENTCTTPTADPRGLDISSLGDGARVSRVDIVLQQATDHTVGVDCGGDDVFFDHVHITIDGADKAVGFSLFGADNYLVDSIAAAVGVSTGAGIYAYDGATLVISRGSYTGVGTTFGYGLRTYGASVDGSDASFDGSTGAIRMWGIDGPQSGYFSRCQAHATVEVDGDGVDPMTVALSHSSISDFTTTIDLDGAAGTVRVTGSELDGGPVSGPVECVAVWDEGTSFYPNTCP